MIDFGALVLGPCIRIFGEQVIYQSADPAAIAVTGAAATFAVTAVFDEAYRPVDSLSVEGMDPMHITASRPCLGVNLANFPVQPDQGDLVTVRGIRYWVQEVQADGKGGARLMLSLENGQR